MVQIMQAATHPYQGFTSYYEWLREMCRTKQTRAASILSKAGFAPRRGGAGYFLVAEVQQQAGSNVRPPDKFIVKKPNGQQQYEQDDWAFCRWLAEEGKIVALPMSAFTNDQRTATLRRSSSSRREHDDTTRKLDDDSLDNNNSHAKNHWVRLAVCKKDQTLRELDQNLSSWKQTVSQAKQLHKLIGDQTSRRLDG